MQNELLKTLIMLAGCGQLSLLFVAAMLPSQLNWKTELSNLPLLHRQMHWVYSGYVLLAIVAFSLFSLFNAEELAAGSGLARGLCGYMAIFWAIRLVLQGVFDLKPYIKKGWHRMGYHALTVLFISLTIIYTIAAFQLL